MRRETKQRATHRNPSPGVTQSSEANKGHQSSARSTSPRRLRVSVVVVAAVPLCAGVEGLAGSARALAVGLAYLAILGAVGARKRVRVPIPILLYVGFGLTAAASALASTDPTASLLRAIAFLSLIVCAFLVAERSDTGRLAASAFCSSARLAQRTRASRSLSPCRRSCSSKLTDSVAFAALIPRCTQIHWEQSLPSASLSPLGGPDRLLSDAGSGSPARS